MYIKVLNEGQSSSMARPLLSFPFVGKQTRQNLSGHTQTSFPITSCGEIGPQNPFGICQFSMHRSPRVPLLNLNMSLERGTLTSTWAYHCQSSLYQSFALEQWVLVLAALIAWHSFPSGGSLCVRSWRKPGEDWGRWEGRLKGRN